MLQRESLNFLKQIKRPANNSKAWVDEHRDLRDATQADVEAFAGRLIEAVSAFDARVARSNLKPKDCVTRLNRDTRFNGGPSFKSEYYVVIRPGGKKSPHAYYYVHVEPGHAYAGGGIYNCETPDLRKFREGLSREYGRFEKLLSAKAFRTAFPNGLQAMEKNARIPRDFAEDDPAGDFLKFRGYFTIGKLSDADLVTEASFKKILGVLKAAQPLVDFLNDALEAEGVNLRATRKLVPLYPR